MRPHLLTLMIVIGAVLQGCASPAVAPDDDPLLTREPTAATGEATVEPSSSPQPPIEVRGVGASLPASLYVTWIDLFSYVTTRPNIQYEATGSRAGIEAIIAQTADFGASDIPLSEEERALAPDLLMFPTAASAISIPYNLLDSSGEPVRAGLRLDAAALTGIFTGEIEMWNDPALTELNPEINLPNVEIIVFHRASGSGTTYVLSHYLTQTSPAWREAMGEGDDLTWEVGSSVATSAEMAASIAETPYSIGYVNLGDALAARLPYAFLKNREGRFVAPSVESVEAAQTALALHMPDTLDQLLINAPGDESYPIAAYTYILIYEVMPNCDIAWSILSWYRWSLMFGDVAATQAGFSPLIEEVQAAALARFSLLYCEEHEAIPRLIP